MIKNQYILVDTCVISYLLSNNKELRAHTADFLNKLISQSNKLCISMFTEHEILRNISTQKRGDAEKILESFIVVNHTDERQKRATVLYSAYSKDPQVRTIQNSISDIDVFIGSLVFKENKPLLLTANFCDFPRPFFKEKEIQQIEYHNKDKSKNCIYYYLLEANLSSIF